MFSRLYNLTPLPIVFDRWLHRGRPPIGLDFGAHSLKAVQLNHNHGRWSVRAAAEQTWPEDMPNQGEGHTQALTETLGKALDAGSFSGRDAVLLLPAEFMNSKSLRLPPMPPDELAQAVEYEAGDRLNLGGKDTAIQHVSTGEVRQGQDVKQEVLVMAVPEQVIDEYTGVLAASGLDPVAIDSTPTAMARCPMMLDNARERNDEMSDIIVDIGYRTSKVLITRHGHVQFYKQIDIGGRQFDVALAKAMHMTPDDAAEKRRQWVTQDDGSQPADPDLTTAVEAMAQPIDHLGREIGLCLRYYSVTFRGARPKQVMLIGGEARQCWLPDALTTGSGLTCTPFDALADINRADVADAIGPGIASCQWALAASLSRRQAAANRKRGAA